MATLTSTGAVNLTSSTNWSPAQIPAAGDDLVIAAHTLTLDADFTGAGALNTVTFNNISGRMAISGTTRSIQATNGWFVSTGNQTAAILQNIGPGVSVEFIGKWRLDASFGNGFSIVTSVGGNATFRTVGNDATAVLFETTVTSAYPVISLSWATGTLTTVGRFSCALATQQYNIVTMSSGTWSHSSVGVNTPTGSGAQRIAVLNGGTINWTGSVTGQSKWDNSGLFAILTGTTGNTIGQAGDVFTVTGGTGTLTSIVSMAGTGAVELTGKFASTSKAVCFAVSAGTLRYRNQSLTVNNGEDFSIYTFAGAVDLTGLSVTSSGKVGIIATGGSTVTTSAGTLVTNQSASASACATGTTALDGKIVTLPSPAPTLPAVQTVAAGTSYGYAASPLTGTGLIMDPAILATAVRNGVNVTVNPLVGALSGRVLSDMTMNFFKGEVINTTITVVDSSRQPVNMSGMTLRLVFENATTGTDIASVTSFTITGAGSNNATFAVPSAVTNTVTSTPHVWSLRDTGDGNRVIAMGTVVVRAAASLD